MLRFENITLGAGAPSRCRRCHGATEDFFRDAAEIVADVAAVTRAWDSGPGPNLSLTGAEPLRHPALSGVLAGAVQAGARRIRLESDAAALSSQPDAVAIIEAGVRHLQVTVLGSTATLHNGLTGITGAFESTLHGVTMFAETAREQAAPVHITARIPACRHNLHDLPATVTAVAEAGAAAVLLVVEDVHLDLRSASPWFEAACDTGTVNAIWVEVEGVPYGLARGWELHLARTYRNVEGAKSSRCDRCALLAICPGGILGLSPEVLATFRPPEGAERLAEGVARGFSPPCIAAR